MGLPAENNHGRWVERWVLVGAMLYPAVLTWGYFFALSQSPAALQQLAYAVGKTIQFGLPVVWVVGICRQPLRTLWGTGRRALVEGVAFGLAVGLVILVGYRYWLGPTETFQQAAQALQEKLRQTGLNSPGRFVALGCFYALGHSFLEEYYWRGFVFGRLIGWVGWGWALGLSSLAFSFHHVLVLGYYFGWGWTWLFSGAVALGGAYWAWLNHRAGNLWGNWLGHMIIDAAIFAVGYQMAGW